MTTTTERVHDLRARVLAQDTPSLDEFAELVRAYRADRASAVMSKQRKTTAKHADLGAMFGRAPGAGVGGGR